jgi:penicillin-binding protein 1B
VRRSFFIASVASAVAIVALAFGLATYTNRALERFARAESRRTALIYAAGQRLAPGIHTRLIDLAGTLARLDYHEVKGDPTEPGQFRRSTDAWEIFLRPSDEPAMPWQARRVRLDLRGDRIAKVSVDGRDAGSLRLDGEVLSSADDEAGEETRPVRLKELPSMLVDAVLAIEDQRFFEHRGIDLRGLARALWVNTRERRVAQGGSTVTQQLVKNRLLTAERTFARKLSEAWLATVLEWRYSKEVILEAYLNEVYLGQLGGLAIRGVGAASRVYFDKEAHQLTLAESALLAGLIRAPNTYSPALNPDRARERRGVALARMQELGMITAEQRQAADGEPIAPPNRKASGQLAAYFTDRVRQEMEETVGDDAAEGLAVARVYTTLDTTLQRFAEAAVTRGLENVERGYPRLRREKSAERLQAVLIALDPRTGDVVALVGGRDYRTSQFNRAVYARRQPGSAFKPFVFLAALTRTDLSPRLTLASFVQDEPITLTVNHRAWTPRNHEDLYEGRVTLRRALEKSLNAATVRVAEATGLEHVVDTARRLGITSELAPVPSLALGAFEVTPLELAGAYAAFANDGAIWNAAAVIRAPYDAQGFELPVPKPQADEVITPAEAYLMTSLLAGVIDKGTAASVRARGIAADLAGKTGTTNDGRDAWFVGYSPRLLALVWVGFDDGSPHGLSAAQAAVPIWSDFMKQAIDAYPVPAFEIPDGIANVEIDITNGMAANRFCPAVAREVFLSGTEPPPCSEHHSPIERAVDETIDFWRRLRDRFRR